jgi:magnesium chelatase subunit H
MPKPISADSATPIRVVIITLDRHLSSAVDRAAIALRRELPGLRLNLHAAAEWGENQSALADARADVEQADIIIANMLFLEDHIQMIMPSLKARRENCDAMHCAMSAGDIVKLTRLGPFRMDAPQTGIMGMLKRLRGAKKPGGNAGAQQMAMLKRLPQILRFIPGKAQDVRAYFLGLQYWLSGSEANVANMVRILIDRYADGPRRVLRGVVKVGAPQHYPDLGVYHPRMTGRMSERADMLPKVAGQSRGTIGLLVMRSYLLAGNTAHYDGVIEALEAKGLNVIPAFSGGLDARPAVDAFFKRDGKPVIDALVSLTGFSLVGGPAYNDAPAAAAMLAGLDVPYLAAQAIEFQTLDQWGGSDRGLMPVESTMMVAIPELDGATGPVVFGGRTESGGTCTGCARACTFPANENGRDMHVCIERATVLAERTSRLVALRRSERAQRKVAIVLFNFPPNAGNTGSAAFLAVFESLFNTLKAMKAGGYTVDVPASVDALRESILQGNAPRFGTDANVHSRINVNDHIRREKYLGEIEAQWGPAPGRQQSDGTSLFVLGESFGNVLVGIQPSFGYEGDPMRLLFEKGFAPTHAFSAFYRYLREDFGANAVLHFGTHGALEFMPGKQTGLTGQCWPDRLIGDLPNIYLYAANNPSEGTIAKRRSAATLVSYLTPPVAGAGLYRGLIDLKSSLERWRQPGGDFESPDLATLIQAQASGLDLAAVEPAWGDDASDMIQALANAVLELEYTLIPHGLHVVGNKHSVAENTDMLTSLAEASHGLKADRRAVEALVTGVAPVAALALGEMPVDAAHIAAFAELSHARELMDLNSEIDGLLLALDGRFVQPVPGGDILRTTAILPTGRNTHGFDPFRIPSAFAMVDGAKQANRLLARHVECGNPLPSSIAIVLWGTDNLKSEGGPIAQAMALMGTRPRFDSYGRLCGAELVPLSELGRPRIDVVMTLSGIFRDLLPLQTKLLAEAALLAAQADEPAEQNYIRRNALAYQAQHGCDLETAALRVFSNADGTYGANVNHLIENSRWEDEDELAETYQRRKSFAYGVSGRPVQQKELLGSIFAGVELAYQNLESVELGVTTIDQYFDTLGGISRAVKRAGGVAVPVYIGDQTRGEGTVRTLSEQVSLETRTRMLNPKWYEGMLKHGYEGVRQIETHVTNTMGWSATTGAVQPWVFQQVTQTFLLDPVMRERLAALNPTASAKLANRLIEAQRRKYWQPDEATLTALRLAGEELEDRLEGIGVEAAA